jgi:hypothetical protein
MALTKVNYSMLNGEPRNAAQYGAASSRAAAQNTASIQSAIDEMNDGGWIIIPKGCSFNLKDLDGSVNEFTLQYWTNDEADATSVVSNPTTGDGFAGGTNEQIIYSSNWKNNQNQDVNEWRYQAPYHPGIVINTRENLDHYGTGPDFTGRGSLEFHKNNYPLWRVGHSYLDDDNYFAIGSWEIFLTFPIGSSSFSSAPVVGENIVGDTSSARGIITAVTSSEMTVSWRLGTFESGETVTVAGTKTSTVGLPSAPAYDSFNNKVFRMAMKTEGVGVGINTPVDEITGSLTVGGSLYLQTATGGNFGSSAASINLFDDVETPTTGGSFFIDASGNLSLNNHSGSNIGSFDAGGTFTVTLKDAAAGNSVTPSQTCFYRESAGLVFFTINLININTTGLTSGNQIYIVGLPQVAANYTAETVVQASVNSVTSTAGNVTGSIVQNTNYMTLYDNTTSGRSNLNVSAITSGSGDIYISGCYSAK